MFSPFKHHAIAGRSGARHLGTFDSRRNRWARRVELAHDILACALAFGAIAFMALAF